MSVTTTWTRLFTDAAVDSGALAPGESMPAEIAEVLRRHANRMLGQWRQQKRYVWAAQAQEWAFGSSKQAYTVGASADSPDFAVTSGQRPNHIDRAKLVLVNSTPNVEMDLPVLNVQEYSAENVPKLTTTIPGRLYYAPTVPNGTLYPIPYPTNTSNKLKLWWWIQIDDVSAANVGADVTFPDGYDDALIATLTERVCIPLGKTITDDMKALARQGRATIAATSIAAPPMLVSDAPAQAPAGRRLSRFYARDY